MRLLRVELSRFRLRRAVALTLLGGLVLAAVLVASAVYDTRPVGASEIAAAQTQLDQDREAFAQDLERCQRNPERYLGDGATTEQCFSQQPQLEWYLSRSPLDLAQEVGDRGTAVIVLLAGLAIIVGATFAGGDWATGSMSNQLLFVPRRGAVWVAKALAVMLGVAVAAAVVLALFWGALLLVASARDIAVPDAVLRDITLTGLRGVVLCAGAAVGGYALTMLFRHTVGTLALLFGYAVAGEALAATLPFDRMSQWALSQNVFAWIANGVQVYDDSLCDSGPGGGCDNPYYVLTGTHAAWYLGALLVLAAVLSVWSFRRRDVP